MQCTYKHKGCLKVISGDGKSRICVSCKLHVENKKKLKFAEAPTGMKPCSQHRTGCLKWIPIKGPKTCEICTTFKANDRAAMRLKPDQKPKPIAPKGFKFCSSKFKGCIGMIPENGLDTCDACRIRTKELTKARIEKKKEDTPPGMKLCSACNCVACLKWIPIDGSQLCEPCLTTTKKAKKKFRDNAPEGKKLCAGRFKGCKIWISIDGENLCEVCLPNYLKGQTEEQLIDHYFNIRASALGNRSREDVQKSADSLVDEGFALYLKRTKGSKDFRTYAGIGALSKHCNITKRKYGHKNYKYFDQTKPTTDLLATGLAEIKIYFRLAEHQGTELMEQTRSGLGNIRTKNVSGEAVLYICTHPSNLPFEATFWNRVELAEKKESKPISEEESIGRFRERYQDERKCSVKFESNNFKY